MYLVFKVYTPKKLNREQKKLIEKLGETALDTVEIANIEKFVKNND